MATCPLFDPLGPYVTGLVDLVDCQARSIGQLGYQSWASTGMIGPLLGGLLTIVVALLGYRLLLGRSILLVELVGLAVRAGFVIALATQWSAYRVVSYDIVMNGPAQIVSQFLGASELGDALVDRTQASYEAMDRLSQPFSVRPQGQIGPPDTTGNLVRSLSAADQTKVAWATYLFLVVVLGSLLSVRVAGGILLALGPIFLTGLLFTSLRGLFFGWARMLGGVAIGSVTVSIALAIELAVLEPQLRSLVVMVTAGEQVNMLPNELLTTVSLFALASVGALLVAFLSIGNLELPAPVHHWMRHVQRPERNASSGEPWRSQSDANDRSRAQVLSDAILAQEQREERANLIAGRRVTVADSRTSGRGSDLNDTTKPSSDALGQNWRRTAKRHSPSAQRREART